MDGAPHERRHLGTWCLSGDTVAIASSGSLKIREYLSLALLALASCRSEPEPNDCWPAIHGPLRAASASSKGWRRDSRYLTMRDGVRIAVDIYLPRDIAATDKLPAILHQTSYHRSHAFRWPLGFFLDGPGGLVELKLELPVQGGRHLQPELFRRRESKAA